jgi:hypothetical protein
MKCVPQQNPSPAHQNCGGQLTFPASETVPNTSESLAYDASVEGMRELVQTQVIYFEDFARFLTGMAYAGPPRTVS